MPWSVLIALGANLGDRERNLRTAIGRLHPAVVPVRLSSIVETEPVDAPAGSPPFLNMVLAGWTPLAPECLLDALQRIERELGRRPGARNAPRPVDLDLILHSAHVRRSPRLTIPHPRYLAREFVMAPLRELRLGWRDPVRGVPLG